MSTSSATERDVAGPDTSPPTAEPDGGAPPVPGPPRRFRFRLGVAGWAVDRWFLLIAIPIGVFFVLAIPPTQGIDESAHFIRAWLVSGGDVVARTEIDGNTGVRHAGGDIDACVIDYVSKFQIRAAEPDDFEPHDYWFDTPPCSPQERGWVIADAASNYTPLSYAPQVVVLSATRAVGLPVPVSFFGGRLAGLAAFIAVVWWAIRLAPGGKSVLMVVALLPTTLMSAATYNADGVADALAILAVALGVTGQLTLPLLLWCAAILFVLAALIQLTQLTPAFGPLGLRDMGRDFWAAGAWSLLSNTVSAVRIQSAPWMLAWLFGPGAVALLQASANLVNLSNPIMTALCNLIPQTAARANRQGPRAAWDAARFYILLGSPLILTVLGLTLALPDLALRIIYGANSPYLGLGDQVRE